MTIPTIRTEDIDLAVPVWIDESTGRYCGRSKTGELANVSFEQFVNHPNVKQIPGKGLYVGFESRETAELT